MTTRSKKHAAAIEKLGAQREWRVAEGLSKVKALAYASFDESVDLHVNLGIDVSKGDQAVRASVVLPHGTGKKSRIIVFAKGEYADQATKAGADLVGVEDLIEKISNGWLDFEYAVATPDLMGAVGKLAKILGPRGLLPNKKVGTVTFDVAQIVKDLKGGRVFFKNDKSGLVHFSIGRVSFDPQKLFDNTIAFLKSLASAKPSTSKGKFIKKVTVSSTMGPGLALVVDEITNL